MLGFFRRLAGTWPARLLFIVLIGAFGLWGVGDVVRNGWSDPDAVARVGGVKLTRADLDAAYRQEVARVSRMIPDPSQVPPQMKAELMRQALSGLVIQQAIVNRAYALGLAAPDSAVKQAVFGIAAFQGQDGKFDRSRFNQLLAQRGLTEAKFLDLVRDDLVQRQLIEQVRVGAEAPAMLSKLVFGFVAEQRVGRIVSLPFAAVAEPAAPAAAVLQRWYDNHPEDYTAPEYRRIRAVILDADTIARNLDVPEADVRAAYDQHKAAFVSDGTRSVQVVSAPSEAAAKTIAAAWQGGAGTPGEDWALVQKQAQALGGAAAELAGLTPAQMPSAELATPVFKAAQDAVVGPVNTPLGWQVARVTGIAPGKNVSFEQARADLAKSIAQQRAAQQLDDKADKLQDKLAGGASLDEVPADSGAAAVEGTLDATGLTTEGEPAPLPAPPDARAHIIARAFATAKGGPTQLTQLPGAPPPAGAPPGTPPAGPVWFAVQVEQVTPPAKRPYATVADKVLADWRRDAVRRTQETSAAALLAAAQGGRTLAAAAQQAGLTSTLTPPVGRTTPPAGVPAELARALFGLKPDSKGGSEPSMVETGDGFVVVELAETRHPDPKLEAAGFDRLTAQLTQSIGNDVEMTYATALRDKAQPRINEATFAQMAQP